MTETKELTWRDYERFLPPANRATARNVHERSCVHEAAHAVAAYGVGAQADFARVPTLRELFGPGTMTNRGSARIPDRVRGEELLLTLLAGDAAAGEEGIEEMQDASAGAEDSDLVRAQREAEALLGAGCRVEQVNALLAEYLDRTRSWIRSEPQWTAVRALAAALATAAETDGIVPGRVIQRLCEEHAPAAAGTLKSERSA